MAGYKTTWLTSRAGVDDADGTSGAAATGVEQQEEHQQQTQQS